MYLGIISIKLEIENAHSRKKLFQLLLIPLHANFNLKGIITQDVFELSYKNTGIFTNN